MNAKRVHGSASTSEDVFLTLAKDEPQVQRGVEDVVQIPSEQRKSRLGFASPKRFSPSKLLASRRTTTGNSKAKAGSSTISPAIELPHQQLQNPGVASAPLPKSPGEKRPRITPYNSSNRIPSYNLASGRSTPQVAIEGNDSSTDLPSPKRRRLPSTDTAALGNSRTPLNRPSISRSQSAATGSATSALPGRYVERATNIPMRMDGAHSPTSSTAPSTVWDELDELKSRIRNLEISGGKPRQKGGTTLEPFDERPRTATTMTTISTVSNRKRAIPQSPRVEAQTSSPIRSHQLLLSALAKAENYVPADIYNALRASASDALDVATLLGYTREGEDISDFALTVNGATTSEKRLRRKVDNLCRNLTDVCIALCDAESDDTGVSLLSTRGRLVSQEINGQDDYSRKQVNGNYSPLNYLDQRRARLDRAASRPSNNLKRANTAEQQRGDPNVSIPHQSLAGNRETTHQNISSSNRPLTRTTTGLLSNQYAGMDLDNDFEDDPTIRVPSRAMTDIQNNHMPSQDLRQFSREYTSRYPMPALAPKHSNISLRSGSTARTYADQSPEPMRPPLPTEAERRSSPSSAVLLADRILERRHQRLGGRGHVLGSHGLEAGMLMSDGSRRASGTRGIYSLDERRGSGG